jgi:hypothetical protein
MQALPIPSAMHSPSPTLPRLPALWAQTLLTLVLSLVLTSAQASVDDAHSFAMEAAIPFVEQGFIVREDYWNGEIKSGQQLMIKHQLFKGNEYAFWLATANEGVKLELKVYDDKGKAIEIEQKPATLWTTARVNPPKTGTYTLVFSLKSKTEVGLFWALAYGYR